MCDCMTDEKNHIPPKLRKKL